MLNPARSVSHRVVHWTVPDPLPMALSRETMSGDSTEAWQASPMPSASQSSWPGLIALGQLSQASPTWSPSPSAWSAFGTAGQLSSQDGIPSASESAGSAVWEHVALAGSQEATGQLTPSLQIRVVPASHDATAQAAPMALRVPS